MLTAKRHDAFLRRVEKLMCHAQVLPLVAKLDPLHHNLVHIG